MLTPQDIQDVKFAKSFNGYNKEDVEDFLDTVLSDYTALYKENMTLKGKMRALVDKLEEYRMVDEQMRKSFYNAQVTAQENVARAQAEAEQILRSARLEAENRASDIRAETEIEGRKLELAKSEFAKYAVVIRGMMEEQIRVIGENMDNFELLAEKTAQQLGMDLKAQQAAAAESFEISFEEEAPAEEKAAEDEEDTVDLEKQAEQVQETRQYVPEPDIDDSTRIKFTDLRFGKDYKEEE